MKILFNIFLLLSFSFSQALITSTEVDDDGNLNGIKYYKKTRDGIELVKREGYYDSGKKSSEGKYKDGVVTGVWTFWHKNGQIKKTGELAPTPGRSDSRPQTIGRWVYYYDNGQIKHQGDWEKSEYSPKRVGIWKTYHDTGEIAYVGTYVDGREEGEHIWYFKNGKKESISFFKSGDRVSDTIYYNEDGALATKNDLNFSRFFELKHWYPSRF